MNNDVSSLRDTIIPKSDQLNADQLLGGPMTIKVTAVRRSDSAEQPLSIHYENENGRPYKPCKSMRKLLIHVWGDDGNKWIGRSMTLFNDPAVMWAGVAVGGVRISHLSDIQGVVNISLAATRGKKVLAKVLPLVVTQEAAPSPALVEKYRAGLTGKAQSGVAAVRDAWGKTPDNIKQALGDGFLKTLLAAATEYDNQQPEADAAVAALNAAAAQVEPAATTPAPAANVKDSDPF